MTMPGMQTRPRSARCRPQAISVKYENHKPDANGAEGHVQLKTTDVMKTSLIHTATAALALLAVHPPAYGQEMTPVAGTPVMLESLYYDYDGDGRLDCLKTVTLGPEEGYRRIVAWCSADGTIIRQLDGIDLSDDAIRLVAEINGDGCPDFVATADGGEWLFVSDTGGNYDRIAIGTNTRSHTVADINRDGRDDLFFYVRTSDWPTEYTPSVLIRRSDGTFTAKALPVVTDAAELYGADFSSGGSGMFTVDNTCFAGAWLPERGAGSVTEPDRMDVMDLNGDSYPDLFAPSGTAFLSLPDGRYYAATLGSTVKACEINGDGITDYVIYDGGGGDVSVMLSSAAGYTTVRVAGGADYTGIHPCDLDGDGWQDIMLTIDKEQGGGYAYIIFLRNGGDGTFTATERALDGDYTFHDIVWPDGHPALCAVREYMTGEGYMTHSFTAITWDAAFDLTETSLLPEGYLLANPSDPFMADLNGDGRLDVLATQNNMDYCICTPAAASTADIPAPPTPTLAVDAATGLLRIEWQAPAGTQDMTFNVRVGSTPGGDDLVHGDANADGSRRTTAGGNAGIATYMTLNAGTWPEGTCYIAVQTVSGDGRGSAWSDEVTLDNRLLSTEFVTSSHLISTVDTLTVSPLMARQGTEYTYDAAPDGRIVSQGSDGTAHITFASHGLKDVTLTADGHSFTQRVRVVPMRTDRSQDGYAGQVFDFDQDGWVEGFAGKFHTNDRGTFKELAQSFNSTLDINHEGYAIDYDRDGRADVYGNYITAGSQKPRVLLNRGGMDFEAHDGDIYANGSTQPMITYPYPVGDIDNDGLVDFVAASRLYRNDGGGQLTEVSLYENDEYIWPVALTDFDLDGCLDIVAAYSWDRGTSQVYRQAVFINRGGWQFERHELPVQSSTYTVAGIADVNGDGRADVIYADRSGDSYRYYAYLYDSSMEFGTRVALAGIPGADFDLDGLPECFTADNDSIVFAGRDGQSSVMENTLDLGIADPLKVIPGNIVDGIQPLLADVDGDGIPDWNAADRIRTSAANSAPTVPAGIYASQTADGLTIYWDAATDAETPAHGLRYNVSVKLKGAEGEDSYLISPLNMTDDRAATTEPGFMHYRQATQMTIPLTAIEAGQTYEIRVQAVDPWGAHSDFSPTVEFTAQEMAIISLPGKGLAGRPVEIETTIVGQPQWDTDGGVIDDNTITWSEPGIKTVTAHVGGITSSARIEIIPQPDLSIGIPSQVLAGAPVAATMPEYACRPDVQTEVVLDEGITLGYEKGQREAVAVFPDTDGNYEIEVRATDGTLGTITQTTSVEVTGAGFAPAITQVATGTDGRNRITWDTSLTLPSPLLPGTVRVYRETNVSGRFDVVGEAAFAEGALTDMTSTPALQAQRYFITMIADYGGESRCSDTHANCHLMVNKGAGHDINLIWSPYEGRDVAQYVIMSGPSPDRLSRLAAVSGHTLSYTHRRTEDATTYYALVMRFDAAQQQYAPGRKAADDDDNRSNIVSSTDAFDVTMASDIAITAAEDEMRLDDDRPVLHLRATVLPVSTTIKRVQWEIIEGGDLADISHDGAVTLKANATGGTVTVRASATDGSGVSSTVTIEASPYSDITPDAQAGDSITIYATDGAIVITGIDSPTTVRLIDLQGVTIMHKRTACDTAIPTDGLRGIYIVRAGQTVCKVLVR